MRKIALFLLLLVATSASAKSTLLFSIDVIRHGDRSPVVSLPNAPYHWKNGLGQLTARGMQQELELGQRLHKEYVTKSHLLTGTYHPEAIYVRSTNFDRTLMSADSLLMGLYPLGTGPMLTEISSPALPGGYQPIPIHTIPKKLDTLFFPARDKHFKNISQRYVLKTKYWQDENSRFAPYYKHWHKVSGLKMRDLSDVINLADNLFVRQQHQIPIPAGFSKTDVKNILSAGQFGMVARNRPKAIGRFYSQNLLTRISQQMKTASFGHSPLKYVLYSAHDSTLLALMSAMDVPLNIVPHYASNLQFSLWQTAKGNKVTITFNGKPVVLPACHYKTCTLSQFEKMVKA